MAHLFKVNRLYVNRIPVLLLDNFNVPVNYLQQSNVLQTIIDTIKEDYQVNETEALYFAVSATLYLQNQNTGEERFFCGSFHAKGIYQSLLVPFQRFNVNSFNNIILRHTNPENVLNKLSALLPNSVWKVTSLQSIVIHFQGKSSNIKKSAENVFV